MDVPKRLKQIVAIAEANGWAYDETQAGHPRLTPPADVVDPYYPGRPAAPITFSKTPSDHRGDKNAQAYLRRCGVDLPRKGDPKRKERRP